MQGWGISVIVGWTDLADVATRPVQLIGGRTWKGSAFGGEKIIPPNTHSHKPTHLCILIFVEPNLTYCSLKLNAMASNSPLNSMGPCKMAPVHKNVLTLLVGHTQRHKYIYKALFIYCNLVDFNHDCRV